MYNKRLYLHNTKKIMTTINSILISHCKRIEQKRKTLNNLNILAKTRNFFYKFFLIFIFTFFFIFIQFIFLHFYLTYIKHAF